MLHACCKSAQRSCEQPDQGDGHPRDPEGVHQEQPGNPFDQVAADAVHLGPKLLHGGRQVGFRHEVGRHLVGQGFRESIIARLIPSPSRAAFMASADDSELAGGEQLVVVIVREHLRVGTSLWITDLE
jgi:hypothetical protein